mgnify:CR=1 FL=1
MNLSKSARAEFGKLGRKHGGKGGVNRAAALTPERRQEIARKAAQARWAKKEQAENKGMMTVDDLLGAMKHAETIKPLADEIGISVVQTAELLERWAKSGAK